MKRVISTVIVFILIAAPLGALGQSYVTDYLSAMEAATEVLFTAKDNKVYDDASPAVWGWSAEKDGMTVSTAEGVNYLKFFRTASYTDGGNLVLSDDIYNATAKSNCDYVVLSFVTASDEADGEHIYTLYGARSNTSGKEILKLKYKNGGIYPCTAQGQNADTYTSSPVVSGNNIPVRIFFIREANVLRYVYQAKINGWSTVYEGETNLAAFDAGLGTIRSFVKYGTPGAYTAFGDITIKSGRTENVNYSTARFMEYLDRGLVAMKTDEGIYLSWRLLGTDDYDAAFDVYKNGARIAGVTSTTNYIDRSGTEKDEYYVVNNGERSAAVRAFESGSNYFDIPLSKPPAAKLPDGTVVEYTPWDITAGDLDGDGELELVQRWDAPRRHAGDSGYTGPLVLDAYKMDGTVLWRIDLGVNVRCNTENIFTVYDYNCDGVCEIVAKTAPGSRDGTGRYVTEASLDSTIRNADNTKDYRNSNGTVLDGDEYYTIFDGRNGKALDTIYYPIPRGSGNDFYIWGDNYGHRSEKYLDVPAYLDGTHPYVVTWRGIYSGQSKYGTGRTAAAAFRITEDNRFRLEYTFDTKTAGSEYVGQGNHNITVGDVDNDGKDEIISGNLCLDDDLSVLWCSGKGHGDALHLGNYDPTTEGLEYMTVHENAPYGMTVYNAATGEELLHVDGTGDTGRGVMANVGSGGYYQVWGAGTYQSNGGTSFAETPLSGHSYNFRIFWDGDTYDELLDASNSSTDHTPVITSYNKATGAMEEIFRAWDSETINNTKATVALSADILGDWREEVVAIREDMKAIRVFVSPIYTENKIYTLLHDSQYRQAVAWEHEYYNQPPHIGFYLSGDNNEYDEREIKPDIQIAKYEETEYEKAVKIEAGVLESPKEPNASNLIDLDGDYFPAHSVLTWIGGSGQLENTLYSLSGRVYSYVAAGNVRHGGVMRSWGLEAKDGKFLIVSGNNAGNYGTTFSISSTGAVTDTGKLQLDFAFLKNYASDGTKDRGKNNAWIRLGDDVTLFYDSAKLTLSLNEEIIHTFATDDDAQKWSELDADVNVGDGKMDLKIAFGDGAEYSNAVSIVKNKHLNTIKAETLGWGCILLDSVTLSAESSESFIYSTAGFDTTTYSPITKGVIEMDIIPFELSDNVVGITSSGYQPTGYGDLNIIVRFNPDGTMDAYNGSGYASYSTVNYAANERYHLRIETDVQKKTYSAWLIDGGGNSYTIAQSYAYRSTAPIVSSLSDLALAGGSGVGGGKLAATNVTFFNNIPESYVSFADITDGKLTVTVTGKAKILVSCIDENSMVEKGFVLSFDEGGTKEIALSESCVYVKLYTWEIPSLEPAAAIRAVR